MLVEFTGSNFPRFDKLAGLHCSDVVFRDSHLKLKMRWSKTNKYRQGSEEVIAEVGRVACPVQMLKEYLHLGNTG